MCHQIRKHTAKPTSTMNGLQEKLKNTKLSSFIRKEPQNDKDNYFKRVKGSDPRVQTCRGKLQHKRSKLNQEINKEMMLRSGAENLLKASQNKKMKEAVALELSFVNSNLQLLTEQLTELNSSVEVYQGNSSSRNVPMIPLGLKETKPVDFKEPFKDFILEHYSEDALEYEDAILEFMEIRQAVQTPQRELSGIALLFEYFNQLYYIERRFFPPDRSLGIYFEWFDSLTGLPSCQRTVAFEKASVLYNIAALYTQIGAHQERTSHAGLESAVDSYLRAAGLFRYIVDNFSNAPSTDLDPETLDILANLMLAQARECLFEKLTLNGTKCEDVSAYLDISQEAAQVSDVYNRVHKAMTVDGMKECMPRSWISLVHMKKEYYSGLAHYHVAVALLDQVGELPPRTKDTLMYMQVDRENRATTVDVKVPKNDEERKLLGKSHLREAILLHEESLRVLRMNREFRKRIGVLEIVRDVHDRSLNKYAGLEEEDDFQEVLDPPLISGSSKYQLTLTPPDFAQYKVEDLFRGLGPVAVFSAKHHWSAPRTVHLPRPPHEGLGVSVRGDAPVVVAGVDSGSLAESVGIREGDFIVSINDVDVKWSSHEEVVSLIRKAGDDLQLRLVTPMDRDFLKSKDYEKGSASPHSTTSSSSSGVSSRGSSGMQSPAGSVVSHRTKRLTWNPFRKGQTREKCGSHETVYDSNVILR